VQGTQAPSVFPPKLNQTDTLLMENPMVRIVSNNTRSGLVALIAASFIASISLTACKKQKDAADDAHGHTSSQHPDNHSHVEHAGHDHSSDHAHLDEVTLTSDAIARYGVRVESAQLWLLNQTILAPARVAFNTDAMAHVGSPLRGRVVEIHASVGDAVTKGQTLAVIESAELGDAQIDFLQKRSAVETTKPLVEIANASWERAKKLFDESAGVSLTEVQRREAEYKVAQANLQAAEAAATGAANRLALLGMSKAECAQLASTGIISPRHAITAAISGHVIQREVTHGELVSPERDSIMVIADTSTLWVYADVPEAKVHTVAKGAKAWVTTGGTTQTNHGTSPRTRYEGVVSLVAPVVDAATRTASVRIDVPSDVLPLKPGMFVHVEIVASGATHPAGADEPSPVIAVPDEAVQSIEGMSVIFVPVPGEDRAFAIRPVSVGKSVGGLVPIFSGLVEGEQFVAGGTFILKAELGKGSAEHEH